MSGIRLTTVAFDLAMVALVIISLVGLFTVAFPSKRRRRESQLDAWRRDVP